mmetsp:Transcript_2685/g.5934  ORF Transcript_2685/g.5934 Transcript_2685/m.5934 type:complete len:220 (+) Transcript_2685:510-1169(+)
MPAHARTCQHMHRSQGRNFTNVISGVVHAQRLTPRGRIARHTLITAHGQHGHSSTSAWAHQHLQPVQQLLHRHIIVLCFLLCTHRSPPSRSRKVGRVHMCQVHQRPPLTPRRAVIAELLLPELAHLRHCLWSALLVLGHVRHSASKIPDGRQSAGVRQHVHCLDHRHHVLLHKRGRVLATGQGLQHVLAGVDDRACIMRRRQRGLPFHARAQVKHACVP